jgi:hypothetical protein
MGNLVDLAKLLGVDPAYLGALLGARGLRVDRDGSVDLAVALQSLAAESGAISGGAISGNLELPAPAPAPILELAVRPVQRTARNSLQRLEAHGEVFSILQSQGIEVCWERVRNPRGNWLLLGKNATYRAYLAERRVASTWSGLSIGIMREESFDFLLVWFDARKSGKRSSGVMLYAAHELPAMKGTGKSQGRDWYRISLLPKYSIDKRVHMLTDK